MEQWIIGLVFKYVRMCVDKDACTEYVSTCLHVYNRLVVKTKRELCCPNTCTFPISAPNADGETAAIVCSEQFVNRHIL